MSEVEQTIEQEVESNPALDFVNALQTGSFNNAESLFNDILGDKVQQSLDAERVSVADQIFNGVEPEELDVDDSEIEAVLDADDSYESESEVE
jgi:DNA-directed RNA polymerase specialized sigma54-like protein